MRKWKDRRRYDALVSRFETTKAEYEKVTADIAAKGYPQAGTGAVHPVGREAAGDGDGV